jgi:hypothetical protein
MKELALSARMFKQTMNELQVSFQMISVSASCEIQSSSKTCYRGAFNQLLSIILKQIILVLLPVSNLPYVV